MNESLEKRISKLENELKNMKTAYPVAGSLVDVNLKTSPTYTKVVGSSDVTVRVRYKTSDHGTVFVNMQAIVAVNSNFSVLYPRARAVMEPQTGDGNPVLRIKIANNMSGNSEKYYIRVMAISAIDGKFELL